MVLASPVLFCQTAATDQEWSAFINWVNGLKPGAFRYQAEAFPTYEKKLIADGISAMEAKAVATRLQSR